MCKKFLRPGRAGKLGFTVDGGGDVGSVGGAPFSALTTDTHRPDDPPARRRLLGPFVLAMLMFGITTTLHGLSPLACPLALIWRRRWLAA